MNLAISHKNISTIIKQKTSSYFNIECGVTRQEKKN